MQKIKKYFYLACPDLGRLIYQTSSGTEGDWFHYSIDYRIGTRYMGDHIVDNVKLEAMRNPFLSQPFKI